MTAPVGPTGLAQKCTGKHADDEPAPVHRFGLGVAAFRSTLLIGGGRVGIEQLATTASIDVHLDARRTVQVGGGALLGGTLFAPDGQYHLSTGATASFGYSQLLVEPKGAVPFVLLSGSVSLSTAPTRAGVYWAGDFRGAIAAGWLLFDRVTPYATARLFGGPVFWRGDLGSDQYHFQLGAGVVVGLPGGVDLSAECIPLGEQSLSAGIGFSF